jgi:hypothetical protein
MVPKKKNTADPTRSDTGKGKAVAHQPLPNPEEEENPSEPEYYLLLDLSDDGPPPIHAPLQKRRASELTRPA